MQIMQGRPLLECQYEDADFCPQCEWEDGYAAHCEKILLVTRRSNWSYMDSPTAKGKLTDSLAVGKRLQSYIRHLKVDSGVVRADMESASPKRQSRYNGGK